MPRSTTSSHLLRPARALPPAVVAGLLALGGLVAAAPVAAAHDRLASSTPAADARVATAPETVTLGFEEAPLTLGLDVVVTGPGGVSVVDGSPQVVGTDVVQALAADRPAGTYTVDWRVTSDDGHPVQGEFTFTAQGAVAAATPSAAASSSASPEGSMTTMAEPTDATSTLSATATPTDGGSGGSNGILSDVTGETWAWTAAAGLAGAVAGVVLVRSRRRADRS